ncbi:MAG TPA: PadR family transcriptional regulator [Micropepsaceae bacterium]|nr:PadR family transcriptional regulator [Micropepsaceae bacterium]HRK70242.1 PadR family transcriptional regulator [Micropepsaceae bacterium]
MIQRTDTNADDAQVRKFRKELNSGLSALVVLSILAKAGGEMYGYQIAKELSAGDDDTLPFKQGALYPVLRQLHASGFLTSRVEVSVSGPPRRYYTITDTGRDTLKQWIAAYREVRTFVDNAIGQDEAHA